MIPITFIDIYMFTFYLKNKILKNEGKKQSLTFIYFDEVYKRNKFYSGLRFFK